MSSATGFVRFGFCAAGLVCCQIWFLELTIQNVLSAVHSVHTCFDRPEVCRMFSVAFDRKSGDAQISLKGNPECRKAH